MSYFHLNFCWFETYKQIIEKWTPATRHPSPEGFDDSNYNPCYEFHYLEVNDFRNLKSGDLE